MPAADYNRNLGHLWATNTPEKKIGTMELFETTNWTPLKPSIKN